MNASSESGECASLISTGSFSVFCAAGLPAISFFCSSGSAGSASEDTFPSRWVRRELEEESRYAETCEALAGPIFARQKRNTAVCLRTNQDQSQIGHF